jgi:hypothetical protein
MTVTAYLGSYENSGFYRRRIMSVPGGCQVSAPAVSVAGTYFLKGLQDHVHPCRGRISHAGGMGTPQPLLDGVALPP